MTSSPLATCDQLVTAASDRLFHRIRVSRMMDDWNAFINICNSPHLAVHVREVRWEELAWDTTMLSLWADYFSPKTVLGVPGSATNFPVSHILPHHGPWRQAQVLFPVLHAPSFASATVHQPSFLTAIVKLSKLHTFKSEPMDLCRALQFFSLITVYSLENIMTTGYSWTVLMRLFDLELPARNASRILKNAGLFMFLLPAMAQPHSRVRHLKWADEDLGSLQAALVVWSPWKRVLFLVSVLLWVQTPDVSGLMAALSRATYLQHLKLCTHHQHLRHLRYFGQPFRKGGHCPIEHAFISALKSATGPALRTLYVLGSKTVRSDSSSTDEWGPVLQDHVKTLQDVEFGGWYVSIEGRVHWSYCKMYSSGLRQRKNNGFKGFNPSGCSLMDFIYRNLEGAQALPWTHQR
ncbi:hypothetical protein V8F33_009447 [Rhypophila sp. PSN 637]